MKEAGDKPARAPVAAKKPVAAAGNDLPVTGNPTPPVPVPTPPLGALAAVAGVAVPPPAAAASGAAASGAAPDLGAVRGGTSSAAALRDSAGVDPADPASTPVDEASALATATGVTAHAMGAFANLPGGAGVAASAAPAATADGAAGLVAAAGAVPGMTVAGAPGAPLAATGSAAALGKAVNVHGTAQRPAAKPTVGGAATTPAASGTADDGDEPSVADGMPVSGTGASLPATAGAVPSSDAAGMAVAIATVGQTNNPAAVEAGAPDNSDESAVSASGAPAAGLGAAGVLGAGGAAMNARALSFRGAMVAVGAQGVTALALADGLKPVASDTVSTPGTAGDAAALSLVGANSPAGGPAAPMPTPTFTVHASVDSADFAQGLSDRVSWMVGNGVNSAKLQLNPAQLGPIELNIVVQGDHAQVSMITHSAVTRDALESSSPHLKDMLGAQGFGQVSVDISQRSFQDRSNYTPQYGREASGDRGAAATAAVTASAATASRSSSGALDAYA
jgi:flagellar hook-length control protein FliK